VVCVRRSLVGFSLWSGAATWGCRAELTRPTPPDDPPAAATCENLPPPFPLAKLLTRSEYRRTVFDLLGEAEDPTLAFPAEPEVNGFNNNAASYQATPLLVEELRKAAGSLATRAQARGLNTLVPCDDVDEGACAQRFVADFGRRAFRRPLEAEEHTRFIQLYSEVAAESGTADGLSAVIQAALLSPQFLYRVEAPLARTADSGALGPPLGAYELASRLSYFIWGSMPDEELLTHAGAGDLGTIDGLETEARRLLASPKASERIGEFHGQWLGAARLKSVSRNDSPAGAGESWARSLLGFVDDVFLSGGGTERLLTERRVLVDSTLAPIYGYAPPAEGEIGFVVPPEPRPGLLGQPGLLALLALPDQSSPIRRGVFVREQLLCQGVPAPPPTVNNSPPDPAPGLTTRERFKVHTEAAECAKCHELIDPVGFGFEGYDQLGRYRSEEEGNPIDTSGSLDQVRDESLAGPFQNLDELAARLAHGSTVLHCLGEKWLEFGLGRPPSKNDECQLQIALGPSDETTPLSELIVAIVKSPAFRYAPLASPVENSP
jgi:hypothetical protein